MKLFLDPAERGVNNLAEAGLRGMGSVGQSDRSFTKKQNLNHSMGTDVVPSRFVLRRGRLNELDGLRLPVASLLSGRHHIRPPQYEGSLPAELCLSEGCPETQAGT